MPVLHACTSDIINVYILSFFLICCHKAPIFYNNSPYQVFLKNKCASNPLLLLLALCTYRWTNHLWCHKGWTHPPLSLPDDRQAPDECDLLHDLVRHTGSSVACGACSSAQEILRRANTTATAARGPWQMSLRQTESGGQTLTSAERQRLGYSICPQLYPYWGVLVPRSDLF